MSLLGPRTAGLVGLALAAVLAAELVVDAGSNPPEATATAAVTETSEEAVLVPVYSLPKPDRIHDMAERPLFVAGRRPPEPLPEPAKAPQPMPKPAKRPEFILSAIVREGNRWIAVVGSRDRGAPPPDEVQVGDVVAGWRVERITAQDVVLRRGNQRATVSLRIYADPIPAFGNAAVSKTGKGARPGG